MMHATKQPNHARRRLGLVLALVGLMSAALMKGPIQPASAQTGAPSWSYTRSPTTGGPATLLSDGKVLVFGQRAELYDPSTGTWSLTGSLILSRRGHTATPLGNGKVLVAGGSNFEGREQINNAELYDPATGESRFTGNLNVHREGHTATLLPNGKVLFAGGIVTCCTGCCFEATNVTSTAELYDPATGQWSLTGNLSETRVDHAAVLLQDGKVLVAGGGGDPERSFYLGSAELYDPNTETWSSTGSLNTPRVTHTLTTLPNGNVLVSGGYEDVFPFKELNTTEIYNPATGLWSTTGSPNTARSAHTATLLQNGKVLVVGGMTVNTGGSHSAELYDPATGTWNATASLNTARFNHSATLLNNGKVLVVGGADKRTAELYHPERLVPAPTDPRIILASVSGKKLFITGENFHDGAVILLNGEEQKTKNDAQNPQTKLIRKKAGTKVKPGDKLQVNNPDGSISEEFTYTGL